MSKLAAALRRAALRHPDTEEGIACKGTALESATVKARNKAFLFVGAKVARLKLAESQAEARRLAAKQPDLYRIGAGGWATIQLDGAPPPLALLEKWIAESYRVVAGAKKKK